MTIRSVPRLSQGISVERGRREEMVHTSGLTRYILYLALRALLRNVQNGFPAVLLVSSWYSPQRGQLALFQFAPGKLVSNDRLSSDKVHKRKNRPMAVFTFGAPVRIHSRHPWRSPKGQRYALCQTAFLPFGRRRFKSASTTKQKTAKWRLFVLAHPSGFEPETSASGGEGSNALWWFRINHIYQGFQWVLCIIALFIDIRNTPFKAEKNQ